NNGEQKGEKQTGEKKKGERQKSGEQKSDEEKSGAKDESGGNEQSKPEMSPPKFGQVLEKAASVLKWLAGAILALMVLAAIVIFFLRFLAPFTKWAQGLLDWLSGLWKRKGESKAKKEETVELPPETPRPPPFSSFENPLGQRIPVEEMVTYSF